MDERTFHHNDIKIEEQTSDKLGSLPSNYNQGYNPSGALHAQRGLAMQHQNNGGFNTKPQPSPGMQNEGNYSHQNYGGQNWGAGAQNNNQQNRRRNYNNNNRRPIRNNRFSGSSLSKDDFLRSGFVKKVYGILTVQLLITAVFILLSATSDGYNEFLRANPGLLALSLIVYLVCAFTLICCTKVARTVPTNYILLFSLTIAFAYLTSATTATVDKNTLILASVLTATMVTGLTIYAIYTSTDFTTMGGMLCVGSLILFVACVMQIFISSPWLDWFVSVFGLMLFCGYLIYDTQMIIGGKHKRANMLSTDDYIFAALMLYIDIMVIFLKILEILGKSK